MGAIATADRGLTPGAAAMAAGLCVLWGANAVAIKYTLAGLGPFTSAALRFGLAALMLALWARASGERLAPAAGDRGPLLLNGLLFAFQLALVYVGFTYTHASRGTLLINLQPFFLLFMAHFFLRGDRITPLKLLGLAIGFAGAACLFLDRPGAAAASGLMAGDLMILVSTLGWAAGAAYTKHLIARVPSLQIVFTQLLLAVPLFGLGAAIWDAPPVASFSAGIAAVLLFQAAVTTCFAFLAWNRLLIAHGAVVLHAFVFLIPVSGVLLAALLLGEPLNTPILLALLLISAGILLVQIGGRRELAALIAARRGE